MQYHEQFNAMLAALANGSYLPPVKANGDFKSARYRRAIKALQARNLFVSATGNFPVNDPNATYTIFTPPLNEDVIVCGCSLANQGTLQADRISGEIRIRPPATLSSNYIQPQIAFGPASFSIYFPAPFLLRASDQIAIDFGFNAPQVGTTVSTTDQTIVFFCISVKSCLSQEDAALADDVRRMIQASPYQRKIFLNCVSGDDNAIVYPGALPLVGGEVADPETRPVSSPMLILGMGTTLNASRIAILETAIQHSFTLGEIINIRNLFWTGSFQSNTTGPYYSYFRFPVPHLLRPGAQLSAHLVNGLNAGAIFDGQLGPPTNGTVLSFECLSV